MTPARTRNARQTPTRATAEGTALFARRGASKHAADFYRPFGGDALHVASIALGTYLGECDAADDARYTSTARAALEHGINLLDTAINYRCQRSERTVGVALSRSIEAGVVTRDQVVVCTKGGYIPLDGSPPSTRAEYQSYLEREYFAPGIVSPADIVGGGHSLAPHFLADQIARSRRNLGLDAIDVYYLHNPEQQLEHLDRETLLTRLTDAFALLESECEAGRIGIYGCATWNGLRLPPDDRHHLPLAELMAIARRLAGDAHHFRVVQLPINLAMNEAVRVPTQQVGDRTLTVLEAAAELGLSVAASASLCQAKLSRGLPSQVREALPGFATDAQRAIAFVRSLPVVSAALVGMRSTRHLEENLGAAAPTA